MKPGNRLCKSVNRGMDDMMQEAHALSRNPRIAVVAGKRDLSRKGAEARRHGKSVAGGTGCAIFPAQGGECMLRKGPGRGGA